MSYQNLEKALKLAPQCDGYLDGGGKPKNVVMKAEELLNIKLSRQTIHYFSQYGFIEFFGTEIYGIVKEDFSGNYVGCSIEATLRDRKELNLSAKWLILYDYGDGNMGYLDYSQLNNDGEPPVIMAIYNGEKYVVSEKVAEDLGDFILQLVETQLVDQ